MPRCCLKRCWSSSPPPALDTTTPRLVQRHKYRQAVAQVELLLEADPRNLDYRSLLHRRGRAGRPCQGDRPVRSDGGGRPAIGGRAAVARPRAEDYRPISRGDRGLSRGRGDQTGLRRRLWSLANLKTYRFPDEEIELMRAQEAASATAPFDRYHLCFALGKALEDRGEVEKSWRYYERGKDSSARKAIIGPKSWRPIPQCRSRSARAIFSCAEPAGASRAPTRYSSWACRDRARP